MQKAVTMEKYMIDGFTSDVQGWNTVLPVFFPSPPARPSAPKDPAAPSVASCKKYEYRSRTKVWILTESKGMDMDREKQAPQFP